MAFSTSDVGFVNGQECERFVVRESWLYDRTDFVVVERYSASASDTSDDKMLGNAYSTKQHFFSVA